MLKTFADGTVGTELWTMRRLQGRVRIPEEHAKVDHKAFQLVLVVSAVARPLRLQISIEHFLLPIELAKFGAKTLRFVGPFSSEEQADQKYRR